MCFELLPEDDLELQISESPTPLEPEVLPEDIPDLRIRLGHGRYLDNGGLHDGKPVNLEDGGVSNHLGTYNVEGDSGAGWLLKFHSNTFGELGKS